MGDRRTSNVCVPPPLIPPRKGEGDRSRFASSWMASPCARRPRSNSRCRRARWPMPSPPNGRAQDVRIDPATMPLTRLANSAIDGVAGAGGRGAGRDRQVCRQRSPLLSGGGPAGAVPPAVAGVGPGAGVGARCARRVVPCRPGHHAGDAARAGGRQPWPVRSRRTDAFELAALHVMTTLMGSALLALAHAHGRLRPRRPGPRRMSTRTGRSASGARTPRPRPAASGAGRDAGREPAAGASSPLSPFFMARGLG